MNQLFDAIRAISPYITLIIAIALFLSLEINAHSSKSAALTILGF